MKVIVAGLPKTGTKTMHAALEELGYNVYDTLEHFDHHAQYWHKFWDGKGTTEDFKKMYKDVDAGVDGPMFFYCEEILKAFPDAKVILTIRNEDEWWQSLVRQVDNILSSRSYSIMQAISPTGHRYFRFVQRMMDIEFGSHFFHPFQRVNTLNEMICRRAFRQSNSYIMQKVPKDKLLVFKVSEGWGPLCKFLQVDIPTTQFPHKNARGNLLKELDDHPVMARMKRETLISGCTILVIGGFGLYKAYKKFSIDLFTAFLPIWK